MKEYLILKIQEYLISHSSGIINFAQIHNPAAKRLSFTYTNWHPLLHKFIILQLKNFYSATWVTFIPNNMFINCVVV